MNRNRVDGDAARGIFSANMLAGIGDLAMLGTLVGSDCTNW